MASPSRGLLRTLLCVSAALLFWFVIQLATRDHVHEVSPKTVEVSKFIVVATSPNTVNETIWLEDLPDWKHRVYVSGDQSAPFHTDVNRGNEANVYLTYIIENYDDLPEIIVFTHHHRESVHDDPALWDNVNAIKRLRLPHVLKTGYQALRCEDASSTCNPAGHAWIDHGASAQWQSAWNFAFPDEPHPGPVGCPCCAQFAVSGQMVRQRPLETYLRLRRWVLESEWDTYYSGRVMEYMWHIIFGQPADFCWGRQVCLCEAFGLCSDQK